MQPILYFPPTYKVDYIVAVLAKHRIFDTQDQCDQKKIAKCLYKLPKNDFIRKSKNIDTFTKIT